MYSIVYFTKVSLFSLFRHPLLHFRRNHRQLPAQSYPQYRIHQYQTETSVFY